MTKFPPIFLKFHKLFIIITFLIFSCKEEIPAPIADFSYSIEKKEIIFKNLSINGTSYEWDFGDGVGISKEKEPKYSYKIPGNYSVTLNVVGLGGESKIEKNLDVQAIKPTAGFSYTLLLNGEVQFKNESKDADSFIWEIEEHGKNTQNDPKVVFSYNGNYKVKLKAEGYGANDEIEQVIIVNNTKDRPPMADFDYLDVGQGKFKFKNKSTNSTSYIWDFGDSKGKSIVENPEYTYEENGSYLVKLLASGKGGEAIKDSIIKVSSSFDYFNYTLENKSAFEIIAYNNDPNQPLQNFKEIAIAPKDKAIIRVKSKNGVIPMMKSLTPNLIFEYNTVDNKTYILNAFSSLYEIKLTGTSEPIKLITNINGQLETYNNIALPHQMITKTFSLDVLQVQVFKNNVNGILNVYIYFKGVLIKTETITDPFADILIEYNITNKSFKVKETSPEEWYCGSYNGIRLITGPKGGCYYINSNGNKTYVDRSYCNCK